MRESAPRFCELPPPARVAKGGPSVGLGNPLFRFEWIGWKRRPVAHLLVGILFIGLIGFLFIARGDSVFGPGYSSWIYGLVYGSNSMGAAAPTPLAMFFSFVAVTFEKSIVRLTTLLPWWLVIRAVYRARRARLFDSLQTAPLTSREWMAGLLAPSIFVSLLALLVFLSAVVLPDMLSRYPTLQSSARAQNRLALLGTIPFMGFEGVANILLVACVTLHESLRSRQTATIVLHSFLWIVLIQLAHSVAAYGLAMVPRLLSWRVSSAVYIFLATALPLAGIAIPKLVVALVMLRRFSRGLLARLQQDTEQAA